MDTVKISILVPVYNVENYLPRCIESVLSQDFTDYELILVDDGSSDNCPAICDEYMVKDNRVRVIHKENGGHTTARLAGFQQASGKYIMFLDSDDYLFPNALSFLYDKIEEGYDVVKGINKLIYCNGKYIIEKYKVCNAEVIGNENYLIKVINAEVAPYLWGGLYRRDLIKEDDFKCILGFSVGEDWLLNIAIATRVSKMYCIDKEVYCYSVRDDSIMRTKICSYEYGEKLREIVRFFTRDHSSKVKFWVNINRICSLISNNFTPELKFNSQSYNIILKNINNKEIYSVIKSKVDKKHLLFIRHKFLFILYTMLYKKLYKLIKLKNIERKIIY